MPGQDVLLEQGVMGAIILLLVAGIVAQWFQSRKQYNETLEDLRGRNDSLTSIVKNTIKEELELAKADAKRSREFHTTLTLLTGVIREMGDSYERSGPDHSN